ncbi:hypothetical protein LINPERPRIM_LOCUS14782 [Linum perenne]
MAMASWCHFSAYKKFSLGASSAHSSALIRPADSISSNFVQKERTRSSYSSLQSHRDHSTS